MRRVTRRTTPSQLICYKVRGGEIQRNARVGQRWTNPRRQFVRATKFSAAAPNICGSAVCSLLHVTLVTPWIAARWIAGYLWTFLRLWVRIFDTPEEKWAVSLQTTSVQPTLLRYERTNGQKKKEKRCHVYLWWFFVLPDQTNWQTSSSLSLLQLSLEVWLYIVFRDRKQMFVLRGRFLLSRGLHYDMIILWAEWNRTRVIYIYILWCYVLIVLQVFW